MKTYSVECNDLGYRSISYTVWDDTSVPKPYDWTSHFDPDEYDQYRAMIRRLERQGYVCHIPQPYVPSPGPELVPALTRGTAK